MNVMGQRKPTVSIFLVNINYFDPFEMYCWLAAFCQLWAIAAHQ
jgi:hypothetical protein